MTTEPLRPACADRYLLMWSTHVEDHREAKKLCLGDQSSGTPICPLFDKCHNETPPPSANHDGTWAGVLYVDGRPSQAGRRNARVSA